jgi:hypothetical protein
VTADLVVIYALGVLSGMVLALLLGLFGTWLDSRRSRDAVSPRSDRNDR